MTQEDLCKLVNIYFNNTHSKVDLPPTFYDIDNAYEAGFKKALELVLEDNIQKMMEATDFNHPNAREAVLDFILNNFKEFL